jgi:nucleoid-associated protein YgaU
MAGPPKQGKAFLEIEDGGELQCMFNPADLTISKSNSWDSGKAKGVNAPDLKFQSGQSATLTLSLTFDTTREGGAVTHYTTQLLDLMKIRKTGKGSSKENNSGRPPWVRFHWGSASSFKAVVDRLQIKFTYFASDGTPLRAKVDLTLKQFSNEELLPYQNPTSYTPTLHTVHRLLPGETLDRVAARAYGDATRWRLIAEANGIQDPLRLPVGTMLAIPEPGVRRRDEGGRRG